MLSKDDARGQFPIPNPSPAAIRFQVSVLRSRLLALAMRTKAFSGTGPHAPRALQIHPLREALAHESLDEAVFTQFRLMASLG
jgi:hypothetical protein